MAKLRQTQIATVLDGVYKTLDPRPLVELEELRAFYRDELNPVRGGDRTRRLKLGLDRAFGGSFYKGFLMGYAGAGKSTELSRLIPQVEDRFQVIQFSVRSDLDALNFAPLDVVPFMMAETPVLPEELQIRAGEDLSSTLNTRETGSHKEIHRNHLLNMRGLMTLSFAKLAQIWHDLRRSVKVVGSHFDKSPPDLVSPSPQDTPLSDLRRTGWDTLNAFAYILGTALIEVVKSSLFPTGIPTLTDIVLTLGQLSFIIGLLIRLWRVIDQLIVEIWQSKTIQVLYDNRRSRKDAPPEEEGSPELDFQGENNNDKS